MSEQVNFKFINSEFEKLKDVIKSKGSIIEPITRNNTKTVDYIIADISLFNRRGYTFRTFLETPLFALVEHIDCFIPTTELEHSVDLRQFLISTMTNFYNSHNVIGYESKLISFVDSFVEHFNTRDHAKEWNMTNLIPFGKKFTVRNIVADYFNHLTKKYENTFTDKDLADMKTVLDNLDDFMSELEKDVNAKNAELLNKTTVISVNVSPVSHSFGAEFNFLCANSKKVIVEILPRDIGQGREYVRDKLSTALQDNDVIPNYDMIDFYINKIPQWENHNG